MAKVTAHTMADYHLTPSERVGHVCALVRGSGTRKENLLSYALSQSQVATHPPTTATAASTPFPPSIPFRPL